MWHLLVKKYKFLISIIIILIVFRSIFQGDIIEVYVRHPSGLLKNINSHKYVYKSPSGIYVIENNRIYFRGEFFKINHFNIMICRHIDLDILLEGHNSKVNSFNAHLNISENKIEFDGFPIVSNQDKEHYYFPL
jgi:hypothetical protein